MAGADNPLSSNGESWFSGRQPPRSALWVQNAGELPTTIKLGIASPAAAQPAVDFWPLAAGPGGPCLLLTGCPPDARSIHTQQTAPGAIIVALLRPQKPEESAMGGQVGSWLLLPFLACCSPAAHHALQHTSTPIARPSRHHILPSAPR